MHNHIVWELCPFELRNFPKYTSEAACQRNSSETTEQNFMNMHNRIVCPYYLPSFMKFCSVVSEELPWQAASVVYFRNYFSSKILLKQLVRATPLKLLNRISWNLVGSKDTLCGCAYYQEILIYWKVYFWKFLSSKGHNSHKVQAIKISW
jgi:hypothetical protein